MVGHAGVGPLCRIIYGSTCTGERNPSGAVAVPTLLHSERLRTTGEATLVGSLKEQSWRWCYAVAVAPLTECSDRPFPVRFCVLVVRWASHEVNHIASPVLLSQIRDSAPSATCSTSLRDVLVNGLVLPRLGILDDTLLLHVLGSVSAATPTRLRPVLLLLVLRHNGPLSIPRSAENATYR